MYICDLINIWESKVNGRWQLFYSYTDLGCGGGISDGKDDDLFSLRVIPNPVRNNTTLHYSLEEPSFIKISLHTIDGRISEVIFSDHRTKGDHSLEMDLDEVFPGIKSYQMLLIRLETAHGTAVQKILFTQ
jgi:hypothetical protein